MTPDFLSRLVNQQLLSSEAADRAFQSSVSRRVALERVLTHEMGIDETTVLKAIRDAESIQFIDVRENPPDLRLVRMFGAPLCLEYRVLPWKKDGDLTVVLTANRNPSPACRAALETAFGRVKFSLTASTSITSVITSHFARELAYKAETTLAGQFSSRNWNAIALRLWAFALLLPFSALFVAYPFVALEGVLLCAIAVFALSTALKTLALFASRPPNDLQFSTVNSNQTTTVSLLIPLFKEGLIAPHLIEQISRIDYPKALLDVCLLVESDDAATLSVLQRIDVPNWIRIISVPAGTLRTKPRALNYALNFTQGKIIGVYDAEDAPEADQLAKIVRTFANAPANVACVQGSLDYYNADLNWLSRCFTIEYASWFRVVLPGYARLGLVVPLGGTTLFFRRDVLTKLGGWDAHNVTEDADLGIRLARQGYRTVFASSVTGEEANAKPWPWIKQRSRWLKGYAITYAVHMRNPARLFRDVGAWPFFGIQIQFLGTLSQFLLAPLLWSFLLVPFGVSHPVATALTPNAFFWVTALFLFGTTVSLICQCLGVSRAKKPWLMKWTPSLIFYFPLATAAVLKGLAELFWKPFYWDKTKHGKFLPRQRPKSAFSASKRSRTSKAALM